ncbi:Nnf1-domain-containing protein [Coniochaeta sp. 2T2.1]|nr:Nnf1-domain-containing protein [Coniochaeta sp. 2T2.1]
MATDEPPLPPSPPPCASTTPLENNNNPPHNPPSPALPPAPVPLTPGPRASRLQEVYADRLRATLAKVSYANFASCYPTIAANKPALLKSIQAQMVSILQDRCMREFGQILAARETVRKLNELEALVGRAGRKRGEGEIDGREAPVPPHTLPPATIQAAHLAPYLASQQGQLNARLQNTQAENAALFAEIKAQREEAGRLLGLVERVLADVDGASALLDGVVEDVVREGREVEKEMGSTS